MGNVGRFIGRVLVIPVCVMALPVTGAVLDADFGVVMADAEEPATSPAEHRSQRLMDRHGCWSGEAPADMRGVLPGHAVVTVGDETTYSKRNAGLALEHVFDGKHPALVVHGFCR